MSENILEVRHLKKYFPTKRGLLHAVDDVNFSIKKGTTMGWSEIRMRKVNGWPSDLKAYGSNRWGNPLL